MIAIGIDPGTASGAISVLGRKLVTCNMNGNNDSTAFQFLRHHAEKKTAVVFLEKVGGRPRQSGAMKFSEHYGYLLGFLAGLQTCTVPILPAKWQQELGCLTGGDKSVTYAEALRLFPDQYVTKRNADSWLIAHWGKTCYVRP